MNIIEMFEKIKQILDVVNTPRYDDSQLVSEINTVQKELIDERGEPLKNNKGYSFQAVQRVRDELYTIVKQSPAIIAAGNVLPVASYPADYQYLVNLKVTISGNEYNSEPTTYSKLDEDTKNPFRRPTLEYPSKVYHNESVLGLDIIFGNTGVLASGVMDYLKYPSTVLVGTVYTSTHTFAVGNVLIVYSETVVYNGVTYLIGQTITIVAGFLTITSGEVVFGFVNSELPKALHEEICKRVAAKLSISSENYNKQNFVEKEIEKN